jgi:lysophospholipase L1-like esterase
MMHNINDLGTLLVEGSYWNDNPSRSLVFRTRDITAGFVGTSGQSHGEVDLFTTWLPNIARFFFGGTNDDEWSAKRGKIDIEVNYDHLVGQFERSLRSFVDLAQNWNIAPVLMTQSNRLIERPDPVVEKTFDQYEKDWGINYRTYRDMYLAFQDTIRRVARNKNVPLIDLAKSIPQQKQFIYDTVHLTDAGSLMAADLIAEQLADIVQSK